MRKIEREMIAAIKRGKNWKNGSTEVACMDCVTHQSIRVDVKLHGNTIAVRDANGVWRYNLCGWFSVKAYQRVEVEQDQDLPSQD